MDVSYSSPKELLNHIENDYRGYYSICFHDDNTMLCNFVEKKIYLNEKQYVNPTIENVFSFLHELGHIRTSKIYMTRFEMELQATKFAISKSRQYGLKLPYQRKVEYEAYVKRWYDKLDLYSKDKYKHYVLFGRQ